MSMRHPIPPKVYDDGRTKQAFKDDADINKLLQRAQKTGTMSHLQKYETVYADFSGVDWEETQNTLARGRQVFSELPSEVRNEFQNSPGKFFEFVNDPANNDKLAEKLPHLAKPGRQNIDVSGKTPPDDRPEPKAENPTPVSKEPETPTE